MPTIYNLVPEVLWIGLLLLPLVLRAITGLLLLVLAYKTIRYSAVLPRTKLQWSVALAYGIIGTCLVLGLFTQYVSLLGIILTSNILFFGKRFPSLYRDSALFYLLLEGVLFSLIITGAGPLSLDSPL